MTKDQKETGFRPMEDDDLEDGSAGTTGLGTDLPGDPDDKKTSVLDDDKKKAAVLERFVKRQQKAEEE